jgi:hypothetical protein
LAATAALLCAVIASLALTTASAFAEGSDSAEIVNLSEGGTDWFPDIKGPEAPEEYPVRWDQMSPELSMRQVDDQEVVVEYPDGLTAWTIEAELAHDKDGATVPTTVKLTEGDIVTLIVHYRAGNPAAGHAPFVFPIVGGKGWEGGWFTGMVEMNEAKPPVTQPTSPSVPTCEVPSLHGLSLRAAKSRLRGAHCAIGQVRLAAGATTGKGKVVKQFHAAGTQLAAWAPVAVKLGSS